MSEDKLREFSNVHLAKEIYLLLGAVELFAKHREDLTDPLNLCAKNLFLEGVILHSRCLIEFFYNDRFGGSSRDDDVRASDFFDDRSAWCRLRPVKPSHFVSFKSRASKEVVHLTHSRAETADKAAQWDILSTTKSLIEVLKLFIENADPLKIDGNLKDDLDYMCERVEPILDAHWRAVDGV